MSTQNAEPKPKRPRQPDGTIRRASGRHERLWIARKRYRDPPGVWREKKRLAASHREAKDALQAIRDEEAAILAQCTRARLRPLVVCTLDTALRRNEQLTLTWSDVDLEGRTIRVRSLNAKRGVGRTVTITARLLAELQALRKAAERAPGFKG